MIITNAFSINMLNTAKTSAVFQPLTLKEAQAYVDATEWSSAVGHADTAALFSTLLGVEVPMNRATVKVEAASNRVKGRTSLLVGQYSGPRLPEGTSVLPEGATVQWWFVSVTEGV